MFKYTIRTRLRNVIKYKQKRPWCLTCGKPVSKLRYIVKGEYCKHCKKWWDNNLKGGTL